VVAPDSKRGRHVDTVIAEIERCRGEAWDAVLLVACIVAGLKRDSAHYRHAQARMDVWRAGYGLLGDYTDDEGSVRLIVYRTL
jgi:hypothetical protein